MLHLLVGCDASSQTDRFLFFRCRGGDPDHPTDIWQTQTHKENIPDTEWNVFNFRGVLSLDQALASFLRRKRGDMTFKAFSQKVGLPPSTLHRLEQGQQSITLIKLQGLLEKLKCKPSDVFEN